MSDLQTRIADNLAQVRSRISAAAHRSGRSPGDVRLVAVTKYADEREIRALLAAGCNDLGESRPQQLWQRAAALADRDIHWHLIGHLQRNKVERTIPLVALVHSGDSRRLLEAIDAAARNPVAHVDRSHVDRSRVGGVRRVPVLLEVNVSGNPAKHGFAPEGLESQLEALAALAGVEIRGLMAMAGKPDDARAARADFARLRQLRDRLPPVRGVAIHELSMGMSGDYEVAIEEGATMVRIGSALFEGRA
jgi:PLP dependent protein